MWKSSLHLLFALALATIAGNAIGQAHAVVTLFVYTRDGGSSQGSGFVLGQNGVAVTAYHVVQDANDIEAVDSSGRSHKGLKVVAIDPRRDIALLTSDSLKSLQGLQLASAIPGPQSEIRVFGSPRGLPKQILYGRTTSTSTSGLVSSTQLSSSSRKAIFAQELEIVPLDITIYGGLSGAPIVDASGNVFGLLSGSYDEGRGIAWGIPYMYIRDSLNGVSGARDPGSFTWPSLTLMSKTWISLKRSYTKKFSTERMKQLETISGLYSGLGGAKWIAAETVKRAELSDDPFSGRCAVQETRSAEASFPTFDTDKAMVVGRLQVTTITRMEFTGQFDSSRRHCAKRVLGPIEGSSATLKIDSVVQATADDSDSNKVVLTINTEECSVNGRDCPSEAFGKKEAGMIKFVNERMLTWQGMLFRRLN